MFCEVPWLGWASHCIMWGHKHMQGLPMCIYPATLIRYVSKPLSCKIALGLSFLKRVLEWNSNWMIQNCFPVLQPCSRLRHCRGAPPPKIFWTFQWSSWGHIGLWWICWAFIQLFLGSNDFKWHIMLRRIKSSWKVAWGVEWHNAPVITADQLV